MTLPTSNNGAHSEQSKMFTLITGSKFCHCRSCFFCVCYMREERYEKGRGGRKVEREGQQQGPIESNYKISHTTEWKVDLPHPYKKGKPEEEQEQDITSGMQLWLVFAIPDTYRTMDVCIIIMPNPLFTVVVCTHPRHDEFADESSKYWCRVACWKNCCAQK